MSRNTNFVTYRNTDAAHAVGAGITDDAVYIRVFDRNSHIVVNFTPEVAQEALRTLRSGASTSIDGAAVWGEHVKTFCCLERDAKHGLIVFASFHDKAENNAGERTVKVTLPKSKADEFIRCFGELLEPETT